MKLMLHCIIRNFCSILYAYKNLKQLTFDWSLKWLGNSDHNICPKYPEDVIHKKTTEKDATCHNIVQVEKLNTIYGKCNAKQVVSNPVLERNT